VNRSDFGLFLAIAVIFTAVAVIRGVVAPLVRLRVARYRQSLIASDGTGDLAVPPAAEPRQLRDPAIEARLADLDIHAHSFAGASRPSKDRTE
jgi:hypothetical protein